MGERAPSTVIAIDPLMVEIVTIRSWPAGSGGGWLLGQDVAAAVGTGEAGCDVAPAPDVHPVSAMRAAPTSAMRAAPGRWEMELTRLPPRRRGSRWLRIAASPPG